MVDVSDSALSAAYDAVRSDSDPTDWCVFGYEGKKNIVLVGSGTGGIAALTSALDDSACMYGYARVATGDEMSVRAKFVFITWAGESASVMARARMSVHKADVKRVLADYAVELHAESRSDVEEEAIMKAVIKAGGADYSGGGRNKNKAGTSASAAAPAAAAASTPAAAKAPAAAKTPAPVAATSAGSSTTAAKSQKDEAAKEVRKAVKKKADAPAQAAQELEPAQKTPAPAAAVTPAAAPTPAATTPAAATTTAAPAAAETPAATAAAEASATASAVAAAASSVDGASAADIAAFRAVIERLEGLADVYELSPSGAGAGPAAAAAAPAAAAVGSDGVAVSVSEYDAILESYVSTYMRLSKDIGGDVAQQASLVKAAFDTQREFLVMASNSANPGEAGLPPLLTSTGEAIGAVCEFRESNRGSKFYDHLTAMSEGIPALGWVAVSPTPAPHVEAMGQASEFNLNRVLKEYKSKKTPESEAHVEWVKNLKELWTALYKYVKQYHTTGVVWAGTGTATAPAGAKPVAASPAPAATSAGPAVTSDTSGVFAELNQGENVTSGLRKVTADMKTKNQSNKSSVVPASAAKKKTTTTRRKRVGTPKGDPISQLIGTKWSVQNQEGNNEITIAPSADKQTVYICDSNESVVNITGKVNAVTLDGCRKVGVVCQDVITTLEVINCESVQVQAQGSVPSFAVDKTSGIIIYLSEASFGAEIVTAKSDEMNVCVATDDGFTETPLPEQYLSKWNPATRSFETTCVMHG